MNIHKNNRINELVEKLNNNNMSKNEYLEYENLCHVLVSDEVKNMDQIEIIIDYLR